MNWLKYHNSYIIFKINSRYYKRKEKRILKKYGEKELNRFKKSQKRCIWCKRIYTKNSEDFNKYFCCKKCSSLYNKERRQIFKHNNRCEFHKHSLLTYKNECWDCYKKDIYFLLKDNILSYNKIKMFLTLKLHGFKIYPTFRTSKDNWNGDKPAFEQNLIDNNIGWFIYIKFYVNDRNKIIPIVIGKSGSLKVNSSGSDLNFSTNINDGPARKFIKINNFEWCYDFIMIKKCYSRQKAYELETKFMNKFDLYGS